MADRYDDALDAADHWYHQATGGHSLRIHNPAPDVWHEPSSPISDYWHATELNGSTYKRSMLSPISSANGSPKAATQPEEGEELDAPSHFYWPAEEITYRLEEKRFEEYLREERELKARKAPVSPSGTNSSLSDQ